jgi:hypothetical protein
MKAYLIGAIFCCIAAPTYSKDFVKSARSGVTTRMSTYKSWKTDCSANIGVVQVIKKPDNGTLQPSQENTTIGASRFDPARTAHCKGKSVVGFRVDYTSSPNFRGTDHFQIYVTFGNKHKEYDNYTVNVQ